LTNFYRRFVKIFNTITALLIELAKKIIRLKWEIEQEKAFTLLKEKYIFTPLFYLTLQNLLKLNVILHVYSYSSYFTTG